MQVDFAAKELTVKLVYYGPALSGKTTNLMQLHDILDPNRCGDLMTLETKGDRTLFFDFLPIDAGSILGHRIMINLYTVPGQVKYNAIAAVLLP